MNNPLGVSPSKGNQGTTRGKEKIFLTSVGIEPTTSGLDLPLPFVAIGRQLLCSLCVNQGRVEDGFGTGSSCDSSAVHFWLET